MKLRSEIAGNVNLSIYVCICKVFKASNQATRKGNFARIFGKWGGGVRAPCAPGSYVHSYRNYTMDLESLITMPISIQSLDVSVYSSDLVSSIKLSMYAKSESCLTNLK